MTNETTNTISWNELLTEFSKANNKIIFARVSEPFNRFIRIYDPKSKLVYQPAINPDDRYSLTEDKPFNAMLDQFIRDEYSNTLFVTKYLDARFIIYKNEDIADLLGLTEMKSCFTYTILRKSVFKKGEPLINCIYVCSPDRDKAFAIKKNEKLGRELCAWRRCLSF